MSRLDFAGEFRREGANNNEGPVDCTPAVRHETRESAAAPMLRARASGGRPWPPSTITLLATQLLADPRFGKTISIFANETSTPEIATASQADFSCVTDQILPFV